MLLTVDVGNTNVVLGVFQGKKILGHWRLSTNHYQTPDEFAMVIKDLFEHQKIKLQDIKMIIISCVVPPVVEILERMSEKYFGIKPLIVGPGIKTGIRILYENPKEVGADRIANAIAVYEKYGGPAIVVDFGTATTFDAVSEEGDYLGGVIAPGIGISTEALFQKAARLYRVEIEKPKSVIGKNTATSMQSGIFYGFIGQVEEIVQRMKKELGEPVMVVATGGLAELIGKECRSVERIDPLLTLEGLRIIYERNYED